MTRAVARRVLAHNGGRCPKRLRVIFAEGKERDVFG